MAMLGMTLHAPLLVAQEANATVRAMSCLDTVSMASATQRIVYVYAFVRDSTDSRLMESADEFAQSVAQRMRLLLNARGDTLPKGEPIIGWRTIDSHIPLSVIARRDSTPTFQLITPSTDSVAAALLLRAAVATQQEGEGFFWPAEIPGDSLRFALAFAISPEGSVRPEEHLRAAFPVFSVAKPHEVPPGALPTRSHPTYPVPARTMRAEGVVNVEFVVDTTGRVDPATVHEMWPPGHPRPTGELLIAYDAFLKAVKEWLPSARYAPARVGGCPVRQRVEQPFTFNIG